MLKGNQGEKDKALHPSNTMQCFCILALNQMGIIGLQVLSPCQNRFRSSPHGHQATLDKHFRPDAHNMRFHNGENGGEREGKKNNNNPFERRDEGRRRTDDSRTVTGKISVPLFPFFSVASGLFIKLALVVSPLNV